MSKETILKEFDERFNWEEVFGKNSKAQQSLRELFIKAIDQTREETIRDVGDIVNKIIIKDYSNKWGDNVVDFAQDIVNRTTSLIKKELNKLKN